MGDISTVWNATRGDWVLDPLVVGYETITLPTAVQFAIGDGVSASFPLVTARFAGFVGTPTIFKNAGDWRGDEQQYFAPRTNYVRNNTMVGAVVGSPGTIPTWDYGNNGSGLAWSVIDAGQEGGVNCSDLRLAGVATKISESYIFFDVSTAIAPASVGQVWTSSAYLRRIAGSTVNVTGVLLRLEQLNGAVGVGQISGANQIGALDAASIATNRISSTWTVVAGTTTSVRLLFIVQHTAGPVDITLRIGLPQMERSATVTPPILTSGSAVTVTDCTLSPSGLVTFASAPPPGAVLTWRGSYSASKVSGSGGLLAGGDIASAVLISLFTDRVASADDDIPDGSGDPRGWWGDAGEQSLIGSRLWLLEREKQADSVLKRAQDYAKEALQWLIDDGVVARFTIAAEWTRAGMLGMDVIAFKPDGTTLPMRFESAWTFANN